MTNNYKVTIESCSNKNSLNAYLKSYRNSILIDNDSYADKYSCIVVKCDEILAIGLVYYNDGLEPKVLLLDESRRIVIGFNNTVIVIDGKTNETIGKKMIPFPVFELLNHKNKIIVIHEFGIFAINEECSELWKHNGYYNLQDYSINDELIQLTFEGEEPYSITMETGKIM